MLGRETGCLLLSHGNTTLQNSSHHSLREAWDRPCLDEVQTTGSWSQRAHVPAPATPHLSAGGCEQAVSAWEMQSMLSWRSEVQNHGRGPHRRDEKGEIECALRMLNVGRGERGDLILERGKLRKVKESFVSCGRKPTWGVYSPET